MVIGVGRPVVNNIPFMHLSLAEVTFPNSILWVRDGSLMRCHRLILNSSTDIGFLVDNNNIQIPLAIFIGYFLIIIGFHFSFF